MMGTIIASVLLALALAVFWLDASMDGKILLAVLLTLIAGFIVWALRWRSRQSRRFVSILETEPHQVLWVCPTRHLRAAQHESTTFSLTLVGGEKVSMNISASAHDAAEAILRRFCPEAEFGYSSALEQRFANAASANSAVSKTGVSEEPGDTSETLAAAIRDARRLGLYCGYPASGVALLLTVMFFGVGEIIVLVLALGFAITAAALLRYGHRDPRSHRLMVALVEDPARIQDVELAYVGYSGKPQPELRVKYMGGGVDMIPLLPGTEERVMMWVHERRAAGVSSS